VKLVHNIFNNLGKNTVLKTTKILIYPSEEIVTTHM
jgi:hypothetical protein